jgi:hypothetical protein
MQASKQTIYEKEKKKKKKKKKKSTRLVAEPLALLDPDHLWREPEHAGPDLDLNPRHGLLARTRCRLFNRQRGTFRCIPIAIIIGGREKVVQMPHKVPPMVRLFLKQMPFCSSMSHCLH